MTKNFFLKKIIKFSLISSLFFVLFGVGNQVDALWDADPAFDVGTGADNNLNRVVVQSDGKVLIGGKFANYDGASVARLRRLNDDSSLDTTFNSGGIGPNSDVLTLQQ